MSSDPQPPARLVIAEERRRREALRAQRIARFRPWVATAAILLVLFTVIGFFVAPPIARSQLEKQLSAELGRRVTVEKVRMNPYTFSVTVENFSVLEPDDTTRFLGWRRLHVNANPWSSWREWVVKEIALEGFESRVEMNADQSFNFSDILAKVAPPDAAPDPAPAEPARPGRAVRIDTLRVTDAQVDFADHSRPQPFATKLGPLTFALSEFRTVSESDAPYHFEAVTESGEKLAWFGTLQADPPASSGELTIENILLAKYAPYYADRIQADLVEGKLSVRGRYDVSLAEGGRMAKLREGSVEFRGIKVLERSTQESVVDLPSLDISGVQADALTQTVTVDRVALAGGQVRARREKDGTINLIAMLQPSGGTPAAAPPSSPSTPSNVPASPQPDVRIDEFTLKDFRLDVSDQAAPQPTQLALSDIQLSLRQVTLAEGAQMPLQLSLNWAPQGTVRIDGTVALSPAKADLTLDIASLDLVPVGPYLEEFANVHLTQGALTAGLMIEASMPAGQPLAATVTGGAKLEKFGLVDGTLNEELAGFGDLTLRGLRASTAPELAVSLEEIELTGPFARVVMNDDNSLNLAAIMRPEAPPAASGKSIPDAAPSDPAAPAPAEAGKTGVASAEPTPLPKIEIGRIVINDGDFRFNDRSLEPNVSMAINEFGGTISGLSSTKSESATLDLKAMVDGAGPIAITGNINPLGATPTYDVKVDFKNVDLVPLSPYSGKFAGYELARGKLLLDVKLNVEGDKIDSANVITLNQFNFGNQVQSSDATSLPVRLGVALLKDTDGKIVIDVPVQGSMDDPSFQIGQVVSRVIVNMLTKVATSPFALVGSLFGGGGDELAFQEFTPGSAELVDGEIKKLETMVKALTNRPALSLALQGSFDPLPDTQALKEAKLADAVRRTLWEEKRATDPNIPPPEELTLTPEDELAVIKRMYDEKYPPGTRFGAPLPEPPEMLEPPARPRGFFPRLFGAVSGRPGRELKAVEEENARRVAEHAKALEEAIATGLPLDEMRNRLVDELTVDGNDLRALAQSRAQRVQDFLINEGNISPDRLFLAQDRTDGSTESVGARVTLELQ